MPNDRPTLVPPFDVAKYARDSDRNLRRADDARSNDDAPVIDAFEELTDDDAEEVYRARLGDGTRVVVLACSPNNLLQRPHRADQGFVLSQIDGRRTVDEIVAACDMPSVTALLALCDLLDAGTIRLK